MSVVARIRPPRVIATAPSGARTLRAVVRRGLRDNRRAPLTWGGSLGLMTAMMAALWPVIEDSMDELMNSYPAGLKGAFNIAELDSVEAYVDAEMLSLIVPLAIGFLAVRIAARAIAGAEERGYLDTLLAAPVARRHHRGDVARRLGRRCGAVARRARPRLRERVAAGDAVRRARAARSRRAAPRRHRHGGLGTLVAMYVIDVVGKLADPIEPLRSVSAFKYYGSAVSDGIDPLAFTGLALAGALRFDRRDVG